MARAIHVVFLRHQAVDLGKFHADSEIVLEWKISVFIKSNISNIDHEKEYAISSIFLLSIHLQKSGEEGEKDAF